MSPQNYQNDHSRLLAKLSQSADADVAAARSWADKLAAAQVEQAAATTAFTEKFDRDCAVAVVEISDRIRSLRTVAEAIENAGGAQYARVRALRAPLVFSSFSKGFAEKLDALQKLLPPARKALGARLAILAEEGVNFPNAYADQVVRSWQAFIVAVENAIADATLGKSFADARGANHGTRSFENLYGSLTAPLPTTPTF